MFYPGIVTWTDYSYYFPSNHMSHLFTWSDNYLGNTKAGVMFGETYTNQFPFILSLLGFNDHFISYFLYILPMFILMVLIYYLTYKISKSILLSLFCSGLSILNNFILEQLMIWPGYYFYNVIGLAILFYLTFIIYKEGLNYKKGLLLILNSFLIIHPLFLLIYGAYLFLFFIFFHLPSSKIQPVQIVFLFLL